MENQPIILNQRYKLIERIGAGGMASVWRSQDMVLGRTVAVKVLHEGMTGDETFLRQFRQEAHSAANLSHPNIVTVHDTGMDNHRAYIVMEYVHGQTLKQLIRERASEGGLLPLNLTLDIGIQICQAIGYAHRAGIVHCDVKPQNVIVTRDRRVKVADFGIARAMSQASRQEPDLVWGTPQYFSPEQAAGEGPTPASDVYSIGIIMFEMLTGRLPFEGESHTAIALKHIQEPPPPLHTFNSNVPEEIERIVHKVLAKEPAGRYRTAGQLGRILSSYRERSQQSTRMMPPTKVSLRSQPNPVVVTTSLPVPVPKEKEEKVIPQITPTPLPTPTPTPVPAGQPVRVPLHAQPTAVPTQIHLRVNPETDELELDWTAIILGLAALISLLGLIPLWFFVARAWGVF